MKYFYVSLTQQDGEHEHASHHIAKGETLLSVKNRIEHDQLYEYGERPQNSNLSYDDGETAVTNYWLKEIPKEHFDVMQTNNYLYEV